MGLQDILKRDNKKTVVFNNDDINVINCTVEYAQDSKTLDYMIYELEILDNTGQLRHVYKAIKFVRIIRLPKNAKESLSLMAVQNQLLSGVWEKGMNFITVIANIIHPVPVGLVYCYGVQGVADTIEEAKHITNNDFASLVALLQGSYAQLEFRLLNTEEIEWLREKMYSMKHLTVVRGIPKARDGGVDIGNKGAGGGDLNPNAQETSEEFIRGLTDREYIVEVLITPVSRNVLEGWLTQTAKEMTKWNSQLSGSKALSFNLSLPLMYGATLGSSSGWSHGYSDATSVGSATSESVSQSFSESISSSHSVSQGQSVGHSSGVSENSGINQGLSSNQSIGQSSNIGQNIGLNHSDSANVSTSQNHSEGQSLGMSESQGVSNSHSMGTSESAGTSQSTSNSHSVNSSTSNSQSVSNSSSISKGTSSSISDGTSDGISHSNSNGTSDGFSWNKGTSTGTGGSEGTSSGFNGGIGILGGSKGETASSSWSQGTSQGYGGSSSNSHSVSDGYSSGSSHSESFGASSSKSQSFGTSNSKSNSFGEGWSNSNSIGQSHSVGNSESWGNSTSNSVGKSQSASISDSQGISKGQGASDGWSKGMSYGNGLSASQSQGASSGSSYGVGRSEGVSESQSQSESWGTSQGFSKGTSASQGATQSQGRSQGVSQGMTGASSQGLSASGGFGPSVGFSKSFNWLDIEVQNLLTMLNYNNIRLMRANTGDGAFFTDVYIASPDEETKSAVQSLAKSTWYAEEAMVFPLQVMDLTPEEESHLLYHFNAFSSDTTKEGIPGKIESYRYTTILLPLEVVAYTHLPRISEGGIYADVLDVPKFAVPSLKKGEIYIGKILSGERWSMKWGYQTPFEYRLSGDEIMHGFFTGESRSGKTVCATRFVAEVANKVKRKNGKRFRIVAMDPKQDWRILARFVEPERFKFFSLGNPEFLPINLNLWKIPRNVYPQQWIDGLIEIYCRAYGLAERGKSILAESIYALYEEAGVFVENWKEVACERSGAVTFTSIYQRILANKLALEDPAKSGKGKVGNDARDAYSRVLDRMQVFGRPFSIESRLFGRPDGVGVDDLIGGDDVVVLESYGLESTFKNFVFGSITSGFFKYAQGHEGGFKAPSQFETILIVEEANEVLIGNDTGSGGATSGMGGQSEFEKILDQSAGLGLFVFSITQKIADMPTSVVANSGLVFAGKISRPDDVQAVIRKIGREERYDDRDLLKWFPRSPIGWFVCRSSRNFDFKDVEPCLVAVAPLSVEPPTNDELLHMIAVRDAVTRQRELEEQKLNSANPLNNTYVNTNVNNNNNYNFNSTSYMNF